jgi:hypothetical protein
MFFSPEQVERGIFEALRLKAIALGLWVDETLYTTSEQLQTAIANVQTPIEIIGIGDYVSRGEKPRNCLVMDFDTGASGEVGGIGKVVYVPKPNTKYDKIGIPTQSENLTFNVVLIAQDTKYRRLAERIIRASLPQKTYLHGLNEDGSYTQNGFWVFGNGFNDISKGGMYGIERRFSFMVSNVFLEEPADLGEVAAFTEFELSLDPDLDPNK